MRTRWPCVKKADKVDDYYARATVGAGAAESQGVMVKGRVEPAHLWQVLEVVAAVRGVEQGALAQQVLTNSERLFFGGGQ